jgi:hypothetical protein
LVCDVADEEIDTDPDQKYGKTRYGIEERRRRVGRKEGPRKCRCESEERLWNCDAFYVGFGKKVKRVQVVEKRLVLLVLSL